MAAPNTQQQGVRDILLDRYMDSKVDQMREELGVVPDIPQERSLASPEIATSAGVRAWGEGNQAAIEGRAPDVNVRASSRDISLADDVAGRIDYGQDRILDGGRGLRDEGVSAYRGAAQQRDVVDERNHASLARTTPVVSQLMDRVDDFMGGSNEGGGFGTGASSLIELPRGQQPQYPVAGTVSSGTGMRRNPVTGIRSEHRGIDIPARAGTPISSPAAGVVARNDFQEDGAGNYLVIDHPDGSQTKYFHMQSRSALQVGQPVSQGDQLGRVGSTGRSTGPHLHYEVWRNGRAVDPSRNGFR